MRANFAVDPKSLIRSISFKRSRFHQSFVEEWLFSARLGLSLVTPSRIASENTFITRNSTFLDFSDLITEHARIVILPTEVRRLSQNLINPSEIRKISRFGESRSLSFLDLGFVQMPVQKLLILSGVVEKLHVD